MTPPPPSKSPKPSSWASAAAYVPAAKLMDRIALERPPARETQTGIPRNSRKQRVDPPLTTSVLAIARLKTRRMCINFHLGGYCPFPECWYEHGERLKGKELTALRYVSRLAPCKNGLYCDDEDCFSGHQCQPKECHGATCRFPDEMHRVDTKIVDYY